MSPRRLASCSATDSCASSTPITICASSIACSALTMLYFSIVSCTRARRRTPAVSISTRPGHRARTARRRCHASCPAFEGDQPLLAEQPVDQRRLADVRAADHRDPDRILLRRSRLLGAGGETVQRSAHRAHRALPRAQPIRPPARRSRGVEVRRAAPGSSPSDLLTTSRTGLPRGATVSPRGVGRRKPARPSTTSSTRSASSIALRVWVAVNRSRRRSLRPGRRCR